MLCRFDDLRCKELINITTGEKLGYPDDIEFDTCAAKICKLIVYGRPKFFGLFGREPDFEIKWCEIEVIGTDVILVTCDFPSLPRSKSNNMKNLFK